MGGAAGGLLDVSNRTYSDENKKRRKVDDEYEKKLRQDALGVIVKTIKENKNFFNTNKIEDCIQNEEDILRRIMSLPAKEAERDELKERAISYPLSPKSRKKHDMAPVWPDRETPDEDKYPDNVYAESKPSNPLGKKGKKFKDTEVQTFPRD